MLSWPSISPHFQVEFYENDSPLWRYPIQTSSLAVPIRPSFRYHWIVTPEKGNPMRGSFSVADDWEYRADGVDDYGTSGKKVMLRLERAQEGMQMELQCESERRLYLFLTPERLFRVSSRGGSGVTYPASHYDRKDLTSRPKRRPPGPGGYGGVIEVSTRNAPWREYLKLDVSGGRGGLGEPEGRPGRAGRIVTKILP